MISQKRHFVILQLYFNASTGQSHLSTTAYAKNWNLTEKIIQGINSNINHQNTANQ